MVGDALYLASVMEPHADPAERLLLADIQAAAKRVSLVAGDLANSEGLDTSLEALLAAAGL